MSFEVVIYGTPALGETLTLTETIVEPPPEGGGEGEVDPTVGAGYSGFVTGYRPTPKWRFVLCDLDGIPISEISSCAIDKHLSFPLNRPYSCTFRVPSNDPRVNIPYTDGDPFLSCGNRTLKAFRQNPVTGIWTIRFNGYVWLLQDLTEDDSSIYTSVTCYDPWQILDHRIAVTDLGEFEESWTPPSQPLSLLAKLLVDNTNLLADGETGIESSTANGATFKTTGQPSGTKSFTKEYIGPNLTELTDTALCDIWMTPINNIGDPKMVRMHTAKARGVDRPASVFGIATSPSNMSTFSRTVDMNTFANDIYFYGSDGSFTINDIKKSHAKHAGSIAKYRLHQSVDVNFDVGQDQLDTLIATELAIRRFPRLIVNILPTPELSALPWDDYFLGDTVKVFASTTAREALAGSMRVTGIELDVNNDGFEQVTDLQANNV